MLNAPAGALRALARLRTTSSDQAPGAARLRRRALGAWRSLTARVRSAQVDLARPDRVHTRRASVLSPARRRALTVRFASERSVALVTGLIVVAASVVSLQPTSAAPSGAAEGAGTAIRIAVGGEAGYDEMELAGLMGRQAVLAGGEGLIDGPASADYLDDATLWKPVAVDTTVADGKGLIKTYVVQSGDTLVGIAARYGVRMMTVWWANKLTSKDYLKVGQRLVVPTVDGLVHAVAVGDTLESLAAEYKVDASAIVETNGLASEELVVGQTLVMPGAKGEPIPTPAPTRYTGGGGSTTYPPLVNPVGGSFLWPVVGGNNYISQYYRSGHQAIDIAASRGSEVQAVTAGKVIFSGWKSNGGGYQVWVSHGGNLYTAYFHMSSLTVAGGQSVSAGQQVGRIGCTGWCTGPHLHFEVWIGMIWGGGYRVNPLRYY